MLPCPQEHADDMWSYYLARITGRLGTVNHNEGIHSPGCSLDVSHHTGLKTELSILTMILFIYLFIMLVNGPR